MKLRIGDKVKFLYDTGHGEVSAIIDKEKVMVSTEDGFDVPFLASELVRYGEMENRKLSGAEEGEEMEFPKNTDPLVSSEPPMDHDEYPVEDEGIVFALTLDKRHRDITSYLVNSSSYHLFYVVTRNISGEDHLLAKGTLEYDTKIRLVKLVPSQIDEEWDIRINLLFWNHSFFRPVKPVSKNIRIGFQEIRNGTLFIENDFFEEDAAIFGIYSFREKTDGKYDSISLEDLKSILNEKERKEEKRIAAKALKEPSIEEVDLHIESIVDEYRDLSNGEILELQMSRFTTSLETALIHKSRRIVFIHGVGNGKLKHEIRRTLERKYPDLKYQDASFKEYGYGATMVIIPQ